ncbi:HdeD family acid-resistance protein [Pistricoccus aurantiacus]|uniref:HdeD family acid-resistance protein n=1 Tax=Pistricoccus aurantiacus TaxID=1883414 RepID=A0A5B8SRW1_9GAMM|nr:DUF308 domain-containing protein [Pistricoccus aurantiacus]QEA38994.1 hypothetical protein FGL86_07850 [Pistricoccus aurantiacus]
MALRPRNPLLDHLAGHWKELLVVGVVFALLGALGLGAVGLFTLAGVMWFGIMMLLAGLIQILQAFRSSGLTRSLVFLAMGLIYALLGLYAILNPAGASSALTLVIAIFIGLVAVLRLLLAWQLRGAANTLWPMLTGFVGLLLAWMIFAQWPQSGEWVIGLFLAIELLMNGIMLILLAFAAKDREIR